MYCILINISFTMFIRAVKIYRLITFSCLHKNTLQTGCIGKPELA